MKKLHKNLFGIFWGVYACFVNCPHAIANNTDITSFQGGGTYNNVDVFRIDSNANVFISSYNAANFTAVPHTTISNQGVFTHTNNDVFSSPTKIQFGSPTVAYSTAVVAGTGQGLMFTAFLASGTSAAVEGNILIATTTQNNLITVQVAPAISGLTNVIGVAAAAASTGSVVNVLSSGWVMAQTTGTVNAGDVLVSSVSAAGFLATNNSASANAEIAIALQSGNSAGGLIRVKLY